jgi:hypothetical protein
MKHLLRSLCCLGLLVGVAGMAQAAEMTVKGILIDKKCSANALSQGQSFAKSHTKECALMPPCVASGYGVFTAQNKYIVFDAAGNKKALAAIKATKMKDNLEVTVTGDVQGDKIMVKSLKLM